MNQKIKLIMIIFLPCCMSMMIQTSEQDQEPLYSFSLQEGQEIKVPERIYNLIRLPKTVTQQLKLVNSLQDIPMQDIPIIPLNYLSNSSHYSSKELFNKFILPVMNYFLTINETGNYEIIINLILKVTRDLAKENYEICKNVVLLSSFLEIETLIVRAFANVCYDISKDLDSDRKGKEQEWIETQLKKTKALLCPLDLPGVSEEAIDRSYYKLTQYAILGGVSGSRIDFQGKQLRSLEGIQNFIYAAGYHNITFDLRGNDIQDVDPLINAIDQSKTNGNTIDLRNNKLSDSAKKKCDKYNQSIGPSKKEDALPVSLIRIMAEPVLKGALIVGGIYKFSGFFSNKIIHTVLPSKVSSVRLKLGLQALLAGLTGLTLVKFARTKFGVNLYSIAFQPLRNLFTPKRLNKQKNSYGFYILYDK